MNRNRKQPGMKTFKWFIVFSAVLFSSSAKGQNIPSENLVWTISSSQNMLMRKKIDGGSLISYGNQHIVWQDREGMLIESLAITETIGTWGDVKQNGTITYRVKADEKNGNVMFSRNENELSIRLVIVSGNEPVIYEFEITSVGS